MRTLPLVTLAIAFGLGAQTGRTMHATGPFDVDVKPASAAPAGYGRMMLDKHYHGALDASSAGEMLTGGDYKTGTAGYVAMETVTGTLGGKQGSFQLMHIATMEAGKTEMRVSVVPGSGAGALKGLSGTMKIDIAADGKHIYTLDYTLPDKQ